MNNAILPFRNCFNKYQKPFQRVWRQKCQPFQYFSKNPIHQKISNVFKHDAYFNQYQRYLTPFFIKNNTNYLRTHQSCFKNLKMHSMFQNPTYNKKLKELELENRLLKSQEILLKEKYDQTLHIQQLEFNEEKIQSENRLLKDQEIFLKEKYDQTLHIQKLEFNQEKIQLENKSLKDQEIFLKEKYEQELYIQQLESQEAFNQFQLKIDFLQKRLDGKKQKKMIKNEEFNLILYDLIKLSDNFFLHDINHNDKELKLKEKYNKLNSRINDAIDTFSDINLILTNTIKINDENFIAASLKEKLEIIESICEKYKDIDSELNICLRSILEDPENLPYKAKLLAIKEILEEESSIYSYFMDLIKQYKIPNTENNTLLEKMMIIKEFFNKRIQEYFNKSIQEFN
jgi:hypothetical protein